MGKWDVDFDDYDETKGGGGYDGEEPKKGIYDGKLVSFKEHNTSNTPEGGLEWIFEITSGDYAGWRGWVYSNMDTTKWRTQECLFAINGGQKKGATLDPGTDQSSALESKTVKKAKPVRLRITQRKYEEEMRGNVRNVLPADASEAKAEKKKKKGDDPF